VNCYTYNIPPDGNVIAILFGGGLLFNQLLHQLLFLNKECPHNAILDTVCTARSTVGTLYCLLVLGKTGVFLGTKGGNLIVSLNSKKYSEIKVVRQLSSQVPTELETRDNEAKQ
jgi:hypothetical protein